MKLKYAFLFRAIILFVVFTSCDNEPYEGGFFDTLNNNVNCDEFVSNTNEAATKYILSSTADYSSFCNEYKEALINQIVNCGDENNVLQSVVNDLGDCENTEFLLNCEDITIPKIYESSINCNYELFQKLQAVNVYIETKETFHDVDLDGEIDHYSKLIYVTDGIIKTDNLNQFISFESTSYLLNFVIMSNLTNELADDIYLMFGTPNLNTSKASYLIGGHFGSESTTFNTFESGVVGLSKIQDKYKLCFDILIDKEGNCFKGSFEGQFIEASF